MYEEQFSKRLAELRTKKGVSARDMSLSIGQNPGIFVQSNVELPFLPCRTSFIYVVTAHRKDVLRTPLPP